MFDFTPFFKYTKILVSSDDQSNDAWNNVQQAEAWADLELDKIDDHYQFLQNMAFLSGQFYVDVEEPIDFAQEYVDAQ